MLGQLYGRLSAERHDRAVRFFGRYDVVDVLGRERLEIQPVCGVEVGGHRFGVVVDYGDVAARLFERPHAVDGRVVEFDALAYSYGTGAEDYDAALARRPFLHEFRRLVLVVVRGIEVRRFGGELRAAGVDHLIYGAAVLGKRIAADL